MTQSQTSMYNCTHGPKKDCAECLVGELVAALEPLARCAEDCAPKSPDHTILYDGAFVAMVLGDARRARAVLEKAKALYVGPAEVPLDHGHEEAQ